MASERRRGSSATRGSSRAATGDVFGGGASRRDVHGHVELHSCSASSVSVVGTAGFGGSARRGTALSSFAAIHVDVGAADAVREHRVGSGAARVSSLVRPENAKSHGQWAANKKAAERTRLAGLDSWRAEQRRAAQDERLATEKLEESKKGGQWVGLGHKTYPKNKEHHPAREARNSGCSDDVDDRRGDDDADGGEISVSATRSLEASSRHNMNRHLDKILLKCVYGGGGQEKRKKKSVVEVKTRESGLRENNDGQGRRVRLPPGGELEQEGGEDEIS